MWGGGNQYQPVAGDNYGNYGNQQGQPPQQGGYPGPPPQGAYPQQGGYPGPPPQQGGYPGPPQGGPGGSFPQQGGYPAGPGGPPGAYPPAGGADPYGAGPYGQPGMQRGASMMNTALFSASCCVMLGSLYGFLMLFFTFSVVDLLNLIYMFAFGGVLAVLDTPFFKTVNVVGQAKSWTSKYVAILLRVIGKGFILVFLGASLMSTMFSNLGDAFSVLLGLLLCLYVIFIGVASIVVGYMKSQKLKRCQIALGNGVLEQNFVRFAQTYSEQQYREQSGLTISEFNALSDQVGFKWEDPDLQLIFRALSSYPPWRSPPGQAPGMVMEARLTKQDLQVWLNSGTVWL